LLNFDQLNARVDWKNQGNQTDVDFTMSALPMPI
jgi:hypothetical protein